MQRQTLLSISAAAILIVNFNTSFAQIDFTEHIVVDTLDQARGAVAADIDSDGDIDIAGIAQSPGIIAWWENNGRMEFSIHVIEEGYQGGHAIAVADIDNDDDIDIITGSKRRNDILWWENDGHERFSAHVISDNFDGAYRVHAADLDLDRDMDILGVAADGHEICWWENEGDDDFTEHVIVEEYNEPKSVNTVDLDNDGDIDVIGVSDGNNILTWWENNGEQNFERHDLDNDIEDPRQTCAVDLDEDGDIDILLAAGGDANYIWYDNDGDENFERRVIYGDGSSPWPVDAVDLDLDGDIDILGESHFNICWWENDGEQEFTIRVIRNEFGAPQTVIATDIDGDADFDVLAAGFWADEITWWENDINQPVRGINVDPLSIHFGEIVVNGSEESELIISNNSDEVYAVEDITVEGEYFTLEFDGYFNVLPNEEVDVCVTFIPEDEGWFDGLITLMTDDPNAQEVEIELTGAGIRCQWEFIEHVIDDEFDWPCEVSVVDMDNDDDIDIVSIARHEDYIAWWENDGDQNFVRHRIIGNFPVVSLHTIDIDHDGDIDIIAGAGDNIRLWINGGNQRFIIRLVASDLNSVGCVNAADLDGDGEIDILAAARLDEELKWWGNDGDEHFTEYIIGEYELAMYVYPVDLDDDGDMDVLSAGGTQDRIDWWENDGEAEFQQHQIGGRLRQANFIYAVDLDEDSDMDVLTTAYADDDVYWMENDGDENFTSHIVDCNFNAPGTLYDADIDNDGDLDLLGSAKSGNEIAVWLNRGDDPFEQMTITDNFESTQGAIPVDLDDDGDVDVIGISRADGGRIHWWENNLEQLVPNIQIRPLSIEFETPVTTDSAAVTIINTGLAPLTITSQSIVPDDTPFSLGPGSGEEDIEPRGNHTTWVVFTPDEECVYEAIFRIESDDPDEGLVEIPITGISLGIHFTERLLSIEFAIADIYPNPFNSTTTITYHLPHEAHVSLAVYDLCGRMVETLVDERQDCGIYNTTWQPDNLASGLYFVRLEAGGMMQMRKIVLIR